MTWTTPTFDELKMDAEIGSYQEDSDPARDDARGLSLAMQSIDGGQSDDS